MRKIYLKRYETGYWVFEMSQNMNLDLDILFDSFDRTNDSIRIDIEDGLVTIWNSADIKDQKDKHFVSLVQAKKYDDEYARYWLKMWNEIPIVTITEQNYNEVLQQWKDARQEKKNYMIISIDDAGWVSIETKDELSVQDQQDMHDGHQKFLEYRKKWKAYELVADKTHQIWQSPADDVYFSDYLTEEEMVWKKKKL